MDHARANEAGVLVDHFFRHEYGRLTASLALRFGLANLELIEDAVQSALAQALATWSRRGLPQNPAAWLTRVAYNAVIDQLRHRSVADRLAPNVDVPPPMEASPAPAQTEVADDELRMLFVCCHDALSSQTQLVLALKLLCGFSTREIAARLFLTDANVQKLLSRGRKRLAEQCGDPYTSEWADPDAERMTARLDAVQRVIYLLFNEGYSSQRVDEVIRHDLCDEALRLCVLLVSHPRGNQPSSWALLALLHLHRARLDARLDADGGLLMLEQQDRTRWDRAHIYEGMMCLHHSGQGDIFTRYHAEAAILAEHCIAPSFAATRWDRIVELYEALERLHPSPIYTLNRAIALAEWKGPQAGLDLLEALTPPAWLVRYYLWDATLGELHRRVGNTARAIRDLQRALERAPTHAERKVLQDRLQRCGARNPNPRRP